MKIVPSLLAAPRNFSQMKRKLAPLVREKMIDAVHVDVMDGEFVDNYTLDWLNAELVKKLRRTFPSVFIEVHLMVHFPSNYFSEFVKAGANRIWVHAEAMDNAKKLNEGMRKYNVEFGPVLNPETLINMLNGNPGRVLVMTVHPGKGGQKFIRTSLTKIKNIRRKFKHAVISVDGGVNATNSNMLRKAGADEAIVGTAVFKGNAIRNLTKLKRHV